MKPLDLSIIVPLYNEEDNIEPLYRATIQAVEPLGLAFEIIFVDDGSRDQTFARTEALARADRRVRTIKLRRNYGQTPAMVAGIDHARGEILVTMDGDLQNDPADIPQLIQKIHEGYDIVAGWRQRRQDKLVSRVLPSKVANWLIARVTGVSIKDTGCSLKAYRAGLIRNIPLYSEMHRFIPAMTSLAGARIAQIPVRHHPRKFGVSKYGISRIYKVLFDLIAIKSVLILATQPLFSFTGMAFLTGLMSATFFLFALSQTAVRAEGFSVVFVGVGLLFALLALFLVCLGLLAHLVYTTGNFKSADLSKLTLTLIRDGSQTEQKARL